MAGPALHLDLLGVPGLRSGDEPVALSPGAALLCAYLALAPREGRPRSLAAAHLFVDCPDHTARRRLNTTVWRLRTEVRSCTGVEIVATGGPGTVALNTDAVMTTDASQFQQLVEPVLQQPPGDLGEDALTRLEAGVALHRGRLVEPCDDEWVMVERYRIENLYLTALDYLVQHHGARGDVASVTRYGELALEVEPLREDLHRHLISAYGAAGREDLVERQFERCRLLLLVQLGAEPMPETQAAYARFRCGVPAQRAPTDIQALVADLERARREVDRLAGSVDRALERLRELR